MKSIFTLIIIFVWIIPIPASSQENDSLFKKTQFNDSITDIHLTYGNRIRHLNPDMSIDSAKYVILNYLETYQINRDEIQEYKVQQNDILVQIIKIQANKSFDYFELMDGYVAFSFFYYSKDNSFNFIINNDYELPAKEYFSYSNETETFEYYPNEHTLNKYYKVTQDSTGKIKSELFKLYDKPLRLIKGELKTYQKDSKGNWKLISIENITDE